MVNRQVRSQLALGLRRLASGRITNDEYEDLCCDADARTNDPALSELFTYGWLHYDDLRRHKLRGRDALSREQRAAMARVVLFLTTDQEYVHGDVVSSATGYGRPIPIRGCLAVIALAAGFGLYTFVAMNTFILGFILVVIVAAFAYKLIGVVRSRRDRQQGNPSAPAIEATFWPFIDHRASMESFQFWPFASKESYQHALAHPPFLSGRRTP